MEKQVRASPLEALAKQRSHLLLIQFTPSGQEEAFWRWCNDTFRPGLTTRTEVVDAQIYEQHELDITHGQFPRPPFKFLAVCELSLDGADAAAPVIESVEALCRGAPLDSPPATWLYYCASEKVGRLSSARAPMLVLAFANALPGREAEFREWYVTRHIRHALKIDVLVSGQCFERTQFQRSGALPNTYEMIAFYEQDGSPEEFMKCHARVPAEELPFPSLDLDPARFAEWTYVLRDAQLT